MSDGKHTNVQPQKFTFQKSLDSKYLGHLSCLNRIRTPVPLRVIAWTLITGLLVVALTLTYTPWVQTTSGTGVVTTMNPRDRVQSINAVVAGRIAQWYVNDGNSVKEGDPIVLIQDVDNNLVSRLEAQLAAAELKYEATTEAVNTA